MFSIHRQIVPSSAVNFSLVANFISADRPNLILAQANTLSVWELLERSGGSLTKMRQVYSCTLQGNIESMAAYSPPRQNAADMLILGFSEAKMSVVEFSAATYSLQTVSLHYYENDLLKSTFSKLSSPEILVDPSNRCAIMRFYQDQLAVLPFRQADVLSVEEDAAERLPFLPSFVVNTASIDKNIKNVIAFAFLHDCFEPTIAVLFETHKTTTGRLSVLKDNVSLAFISIDLSKKSFAITHLLSNLPYDSRSLLALSKPIGGVLMFGVNSIIHFDQGTRGTGIAINGFASESTNFSLKQDIEHAIHLEGVRYCALNSDWILFATLRGEFYSLLLHKEGRTISQFNLEKLDGFEMTIPSSMTFLAPNYVFSGSAHGKSILYSFAKPKRDAKGGRPAKKPKVIRDELDLYIDGEIAVEEPAVEADNSSTFKLAVRDYIWSMGTLSDMAVGDAAYGFDRFVSPPFDKSSLEVVACSGYRQQSVFTTLQKSMRPYIRSTFNIPDQSLSMWTVMCQPDTSETSPLPHHKFLIINKKGKERRRKVEHYTLVLDTGAQLNEIETGEFYYNGPTVYATSLFGDTRVLQVYPDGVRLVDFETKSRQELLLGRDILDQSVVKEQNLWIREASSAANYLLLLLSNGQLLFLTGDAEKKELELREAPASLTGLTSCSVFEDAAGFFTSGAIPPGKDPVAASSAKRKRTAKEQLADEDDLYGSPDLTNEEDAIQSLHVSLDVNATPVKSYWAVFITDHGSLEIYSLPDFSLAFQVLSFDTMPATLVDSCLAEYPPGLAVNKSDSITDCLLTTFGSKSSSTPTLMVMNKDGDYSVYQAFKHQEVSVSDEHKSRLAIRFKKVEVTHINRAMPDESERNIMEAPYGAASEGRAYKTRRFVEFRALKGLYCDIDDSFVSGVFMTGPRPALMFLSDKQQFRTHPMTVDGPIDCWTPFHNVNCTMGFLYITQTGALRIAQLDRKYNYHRHCPMREIMINDPASLCEFSTRSDELDQELDKFNSPFRMEYHPLSKKYCVISFRETRFHFIKVTDPAITMADDQEAAANNDADLDEPEILSPGKYFPYQRFFSLDLYGGQSWELVDRVSFPKYENVVSMIQTSLDVKVSGTIEKKPFVIIGTCTMKGEDAVVRGKIYIYEIIEVVPKPGRPETNHKFKLAKQEEMRGPVSSVSTVGGLLCVAIGPKLMLYTFEDGEALVGIAFLDTNLSVTSMRSVKNTIVLGDIYKSFCFVGYQEEPMSRLVLLGKDFSQTTVSDLNFMIDDTSLSFVSADNHGNLCAFSYAPQNIASYSGSKLLRHGDFHVSSEIMKSVRVAKRGSIRSEGRNFVNSKRQGLVYAASNGSIGMLMPTNEKKYKRLHDVGNEMMSRVEHPAGLNPKMFRLFKTPERFGANPARNILDGDFEWKIYGAAFAERVKWARNRGTSWEKVVLDMLEADIANDVL